MKHNIKHCNDNMDFVTIKVGIMEGRKRQHQI